MNDLFKIGQPQQIGTAVQGTTTDIHIRGFDICAVGIAAAQREKDDFAFQVFITSEKFIRRALQHFSDLFCGHVIPPR